MMLSVKLYLVSCSNLLLISYFTVGHHMTEHNDDIDDHKQWVHKVLSYSSEYSSKDGSANQVKGKPDVYPDYGDKEEAWTSKYLDEFQFIEVMFKDALFVRSLNIYETFHAGGVKSIFGRNPTGNWQKLWGINHVQDIKEARIFSPPLKIVEFPIKVIRIEIDCTVADSWVEIDAIQMIGTKHRRVRTSASTAAWTISELSPTSSPLSNASVVTLSNFDISSTFITNATSLSTNSSSQFNVSGSTLSNTGDSTEGTIPVSAIVVPIVLITVGTGVLGLILWRRRYLQTILCTKQSQEERTRPAESVDRNAYSNDYTPIEGSLCTGNNYADLDVNDIRPEYSNDYLPMDCNLENNSHHLTSGKKDNYCNIDRTKVSESEEISNESNDYENTVSVIKANKEDSYLHVIL